MINNFRFFYIKLNQKEPNQVNETIPMIKCHINRKQKLKERSKNDKKKKEKASIPCQVEQKLLHHKLPSISQLLCRLILKFPKQINLFALSILEPLRRHQNKQKQYTNMHQSYLTKIFQK